MILPEDGKPKKPDEFYHANAGMERGAFPFEAVMEGYYAQTERRRCDDISAFQALDSAIAAELGVAGTYALWVKDGELASIKQQIQRGLFEGHDLIDFARPFMIEEAEKAFRFRARVKSEVDLHTWAKVALMREIQETGTNPDQIDTEAAAHYLVSGLVEVAADEIQG